MTLILRDTEAIGRLHVLDHGLVELLDWMGDDLAIVEAAQASFDKIPDGYGSKEQGILRFLMKEEHGVPFEHVVLKFRLRMPIFLARQYVKHRTSSWSEHSGRYSALEPLFYIPEPIDVRTQVGKPGRYSFEPVDVATAGDFLVSLEESCQLAWDTYQAALSTGVAKELARMVLPVNLYTTVVWTINARSLFNVIRLRVDSHAQREARVYARALEQLASIVIPDTMSAFVENERPKP